MNELKLFNYHLTQPRVLMRSTIKMLIHLPDTSLETLLNIFNNIWTTVKFPDGWQYTTIIPNPKPGKDPAEPNNYRPTA